MKETDGKREEIKNFAWVLYDREKNTGSGPPPISAIQIPALSHLSFFFFLTTLLQSSSSFRTPLQDLLCLPACYVGRPLPPRSSLPRSSSRLSVTQASRETIPCRQDLGCFPSDLEPSCLCHRPRPGPPSATKPLPSTPARMTVLHSVPWPLPFATRQDNGTASPPRNPATAL